MPPRLFRSIIDLRGILCQWTPAVYSWVSQLVSLDSLAQYFPICFNYGTVPNDLLPDGTPPLCNLFYYKGLHMMHIIMQVQVLNVYSF